MFPIHFYYIEFLLFYALDMLHREADVAALLMSQTRNHEPMSQRRLSIGLALGFTAYVLFPLMGFVRINQLTEYEVNTIFMLS